MAIRIILAEDHKIMLEGLRSLIGKQSGITVIGEAGSGRMAVKLALELLPDIVIMDITMPDLNGIEATYQITSELQDTKVIILSMHDDKLYVIKAFKAGALGYLLKKSTFDELICAVQTVNNSEIYLSPGITDIVIENFVHSLSNNKSLSSSLLTDRECEVLRLIAEGKSTKEISLSLYVSIKTVEVHRKNIKDKLGIYNVAELTKYAIREGLTSLDK